MGKMQRTKGHSFERLVADRYRKTWPRLLVRRSLQAHQPWEPDVVIEGQKVFDLLWTECQCSWEPTPLAKLEQAENDIMGPNKDALKDMAEMGLPRFPIVVWKKSGGRRINVTTRMWVLADLGLAPGTKSFVRSMIVTIDFEDWLAALKRALP